MTPVVPLKTWVILFTESPPRGLTPVIPDVDCVWWTPDLQAQLPSDYLWKLVYPDPGLALAPWALQAGFEQGYGKVLSINWDAQQRLNPKLEPESLIERWLGLLTDDIDVCTTDIDGTVVARPSDAATHYISARQAQLLSTCTLAAQRGQIILALPAPTEANPQVHHVLVVDGTCHDTRCQTSSRGAVLHPLVEYPDWLLPPRLKAIRALHLMYLEEWSQMADVSAQQHFAKLTTQWLGRWRLRRQLRKLKLSGTHPDPDSVKQTVTIRQQPLDWQWSPEPTFATPSALPAPAGLNVMGYVKGEFGQGEAARSLLHACQAAGIAFSVTDMGFQTRHPQADYPVLHHAADRRFPIDLHYINAAQEGITAKFLHEQGLGRNRYTIGFWHWEQPTIPVGHWSAFHYLDEVWAPSQFVAQAVADVSPLPVFTVPHAIVCEPSEHAHRSHFGLPEGRLLVLVMYDFLSYQQRKNPEAAVRAFRMASAQAPEMGLVIKTINGHQHPQALAELKASVSDLPHVFFVDDFLSRQQVWDLQACCDILLSLHRGEGFGLAPAEMMRLGKAVVATGWSANMDFMSEHNSMPVRHTLKPLAQDVGPYPAGPLWAEADEAHAAWCLVQLAQQADLRQRLGQAASQSIRTQLSPQAVGERIAQRLKTLGHWHPQLLAPARAGSRP